MVQIEFTHPATGHGGGSTQSANPERRYVDPGRAQWLLTLLDCVAFFVGFMALFYIALQFLSDDAAAIAAALLAAEATYICVVAMRWIRIYDIDFLTSIGRGSLAALGITTIVGGGILLIVDLMLFRLPLGSWLLWLAAMSCYVAISRLSAGMWAKPLAKTGAFRQRIAIVGGGDDAAAVIDALKTSSDIDVEIVGMFDDRGDDRSPPLVRGYKKVGKLADLQTYAESNLIDLVVVAIPMTAHARLMYLLPGLWKLPVEVRICGQAIDMKLSPRAYSYLGKLPLLTVFSRPINRNSLLVKHMLDKLIAGAIIAVLLPFILLAAWAVLLTSRGPLLTGEKRIGFDGKPLDIWRFRTRYVGENGETETAYTPIGRFLEMTSLDETPELFNVLLGHMSIVGPAPHDQHAEGDIGLYEKVADGYCVRHGLRPGLVSWAQIHGFAGHFDSPEKIENRVKYDLEYVDRFSFLFDLRILAKTPFAYLRSTSPQYSV